MSFYTALSGLQAAQTDMSTISHNLANVSTNGFKKSRTEFADVIASSVTLSPTHMVGSGTLVKGNVQQFGQGNFTQSANALDLAIAGDGFFAVKPNAGSAAVSYTRNGGFSVDADRNVVDSSGGRLQVYPVDGSGAVVATGADGLVGLKLPATSGAPKATAMINATMNLSSSAAIPATATFDRFDASSYNQSTATTIYDAGGNAQTLTTYFKRETAPSATDATSTWSAYSFVGDVPLVAGGAQKQTLTFDATGALTGGRTAAFAPVTPAGATSAQAITLDLGTATKQTASPFAVVSRTQDGKAVGQLQGVTVDEGGMVKASFSNGDTQSLGKVAIANFINPQGLRQQGDSYWTATGVSGTATLGAAGEKGLGTLRSSMIERSNVDITEELVGLIAAQRNFQANSKALDTSNQITQTIFNIRS